MQLGSFDMNSRSKWDGKPLKASRFIVCCPKAETGGPECLHQLVHELRNLGHDAFIAYYPFGQTFKPPNAYSCYDAPQAELVDSQTTLVVVPEVATWIIRRLRKAQTSVNWLSVDFYYERLRVSALRDLAKRYASLLTSRASLWELRNSAHFAQSHYALSFLRSKGLNARLLGDYVGPQHLETKGGLPYQKRTNTIIYNPQKGMKYTNKLIAACPEFTFIPLQNLDRSQVIELLVRSKLYIDFGHHPGKDRAPREAAIHGCCVITGCRGSAGFSRDVPIPEFYKLDECRPNFAERFRIVAGAILADTESHTKEFETYRQIIRDERLLMQRQLADTFVSCK